MKKLACFGFALVLSACSDETVTSEGQAALSLQGSVEVQEATTHEVALAWSTYDEQWASVVVGISASGHYQLEAASAPDESALANSAISLTAAEYGDDSPRVAIGAVVALAEGADPAHIQGYDVLGALPDHMVVYAEDDLAPDSFAAAMFGPLGRGYHLVRLDPSDTMRFVWLGRGAEVCVAEAPVGDEAALDAQCQGPDMTGYGMARVVVDVPFDTAPPVVDGAVALVL